MNCQRCKTESVSWTNDTVSLISGVTAHICVKCRTTFNVMIKHVPEWQEVMVLNARNIYYDHLAEAGTPVSEEDILQLIKDRLEIEDRIRPIVLEFVQPLAAAVEKE